MRAASGGGWGWRGAGVGEGTRPGPRAQVDRDEDKIKSMQMDPFLSLPLSALHPRGAGEGRVCDGDSRRLDHRSGKQKGLELLYIISRQG